MVHGTLDERWQQLCTLSARGAGVFVTVNETNLRGRTAEDIVRVRAVFADFDDAPIVNVQRLRINPHIIVCTSPSKFHVYWLVSDMKRDLCKPTLMRLIRLFDSDCSVNDVSRVMRLPGFSHQKDAENPFMVHIGWAKNEAPRYTAEQVEIALAAAEAACFSPASAAAAPAVAKYTHPTPPDRMKGLDASGANGAPSNVPEVVPYSIEEARKLVTALASLKDSARPYERWWQYGLAIYRLGWGENGFKIWSWFSQLCPEKYDAAKCAAKWASFATAQVPANPITIASIYHDALQAGWIWPEAASTGPAGQLAASVAAENEGDQRSRAMLDSADLRKLLDVHTWAALDVPPEPRLLGDLITPSSRIFLVGRTGLGKTLIAYAIAAGMASGRGFLHWRCDRPSRWLIIDGEMPTALIKKRAEDLIRRTAQIPSGALVLYSQDRAEEFARQVPGLGYLDPLNTEKGREFVVRLVKALGVEGVIFDNVMSLVTGDQKDEVPWSQTLPLVAALSKEGIAQVYLDHTGHNTDRQYGSSTKAWRFDAVGIMTPLSDDQRQRHEIAFTLSFESPGKARRRTPTNWQDFDTTTIRLADDRWTFELVGKSPAKVSPTGRLWYKALLDVFAKSETRGRTTRAAWFAEAARTGLAEAIVDEDTRPRRDTKLARPRKYSIELRNAGLIGIDGETVIDLRGIA